MTVAEHTIAKSADGRSMAALKIARPQRHSRVQQDEESCQCREMSGCVRKWWGPEREHVNTASCLFSGWVKENVL